MGADADLPSDFELFAGLLADRARAETLTRFRVGAEIACKPGAAFDPVTDADREAERALREMIAEAFPDHGIIGEEFDPVREDAEWRWVIDPVDGTRAFVCGVPSWATLIGLERRGVPVLGLIDQPFTDERWIGHSGRAWRRRGDRNSACRTSGQTELAGARLSTTDPRPEGYFSNEESDAFSAVAAAAKVARFSLDAYAYGLLAIGEIDLVIESSLKRHDYCALAPIVEGAGGVISGWRGEPLGECGRGRVIAAASVALHEAASALLRRA